MGAEYVLENHTKKEIITYQHVPASKARDVAGNPVSAAITMWYLLQNTGDQITFVSDYYDKPLSTRAWDEILEYAKVTEKTASVLIRVGILQDRRIAWADEEEPDRVYIRDLRIVWMEQGSSSEADQSIRQ